MANSWQGGPEPPSEAMHVNPVSAGEKIFEATEEAETVLKDAKKAEQAAHATATAAKGLKWGKRVTSSGASKAKQVVDKIPLGTKGKYIAGALGTIGVVGGLIHKHGMKKMDQQVPVRGEYAEPQDTTYGLMDGDSTFINMNGSGYDNPNNQAQLRAGPPMNPALLKRPMSSYGRNNVMNYRNSGNMANGDQTLSRMAS